MRGYKVEFNVYAESQEEADAATRAIKDFISQKAQTGVAVTARKITEALSRWQDNMFVTNYFKR